CDVVDSRGQAGPYRPDRLIGDYRIGGCRSCRNGACDLPGKDIERGTQLTLRLRLTDTHDSDDTRAPGGFGLGTNIGIRLSMVRPAFGMSDDHMRGAGVLQHLGRYVAGVGAALL